VVLEGYSFASVGSSVIQIAELGGVVRHELWARKVPVLEVSPGTLKVFATGKGTSSKVAMIIEARSRLGYEGQDDNEADALWLRALGLAVVNEPICRLPANHTRALHVLAEEAFEVRVRAS
jgi:Holliday junction resolvasome RuvABC endonuclease subunit